MLHMFFPFWFVGAKKQQINTLNAISFAFFVSKKKHMNEHREICCKPPFFAIFTGLP